MASPTAAPLPVELELGDLQGGILSAYGKLGFPKARYILFHVEGAKGGRAFVEALRPKITTARRWPSSKGISTGASPVARPDCTLNIAFTFWGLYALDVPTRTLRGMPDEFIDGMAVRAPILGDDILDNGAEYWDEVWKPGQPKAHILIMLNARTDVDGNALPALAELTDFVLQAATANGLTLLQGHKGDDPRWQDLSAIYAPGADGKPTPQPTEHFGFVDAIGDPVFEGQYPGREEEQRAVGQGAVDGRGNWRPLALANSSWAGRTRRRKWRAAPCRWISAATAASSPIASCTSIWARGTNGSAPAPRIWPPHGRSATCRQPWRS